VLARTVRGYWRINRIHASYIYSARLGVSPRSFLSLLRQEQLLWIPIHHAGRRTTVRYLARTWISANASPSRVARIELRSLLHCAAAKGTHLNWRLKAVDEDQSIAIAVAEPDFIAAG